MRDQTIYSDFTISGRFAERAAKSVKPNFSVIADLREMKTPPQEIGAIHEKAQQIMINYHLDKTAEILDSAILKMVTKKYSTSTNMKKQAFKSMEEAKIWLDE